MDQYRIKFLPDGVTVTIPAGQNLLQAAKAAGIDINSSCGGKGNCDKCLVIPSGSEVPVRACQFFPDCDMSVSVPDTSRRNKIMQIMAHGLNINTDIEVKPNLKLIEVTVQAPEVHDLRSDARRLLNALEDTLPGEDFTFSATMLRELPNIMRAGIYQENAAGKALVVLDNSNRVIGLKTADNPDSRKLFGIAVDLGTTTMVALLVDMITGNVIDRAACSNPQISHGDDIISRINFTMETPGGLQVMQEISIRAINELIGKLCNQHSLDPLDIYEVVAVGNATMQHLLAGVPVSQIGIAPYVAGFCSLINIEAQSCGLIINPAGQLVIAPGIAGHIGGDTVAVALASEIEYDSGANLAVDIGTNGEIILAHDGRLFCCSTAAGPAFEGARILHGMRASGGAIEKFSFNDQTGFVIDTIEKGPAIGICGSGLIDIIACLLDNSVIDETGRMLSADELPENTPAEFRDRLCQHNDQPAFIVIPQNCSGTRENIILTQKDIRQVQLGKAAIAAGIEVLLHTAGLTYNDIERVYMAGAFGNYLHPASARRVGLFPPVPLDKIISIGNAASTGAVAMLINRSLRKHASTLADLMEYIELAARSEFQNIYADKMLF
ncbi:MAG: DUF4445 domain-containing protein [Sedimentisphaerales bacterium]|nr:DUF4445 domain-containing protein [Sedimentisphaerales bacterium]